MPQWTVLSTDTGHATAEIDESTWISVNISVDIQDMQDIRYQLIPLKDVLEQGVGHKMALGRTGTFKLDLIGNSKCSLLDKFEVTCGAGCASNHTCTIADG